MSGSQDYTTLQPWRLQSVLPHQQTCFSKFQNSFLFLFLLHVFLLFPVLAWWQCRTGPVPSCQASSVQLCRPSLRRAGAPRRGHNMIGNLVFAASVAFTSRAVWQGGSGLAPQPCPCPGWAPTSSLILVNCFFPGRVVCMAWKDIKVLTRKQPGFYLANSFYRSKVSTATLHLKDASTSCGSRKALSHKNLAMYKTKQRFLFFFLFC